MYQAALPEFNSKSVALLDNPAIVAQFCNLERRTARGGKDIIDHAPGVHDDLANAVAGALLLAKPQQQGLAFGLSGEAARRSVDQRVPAAKEATS
jgi:hypothetical protein